MKNLINKELKLSFFPMPIVFLALSGLVLIPNYPYYLTFFYTGLGIFLMFQSNRENHDIEYMMCLPIAKRDMVKSRFLHVTIIELLQVLACIPFCLIRSMYAGMENAVGIEANAAFLGFGLIMLGIFNIIFLPMFYKTANKIGLPFLIAS
ncbi:MAG: ABC-2 transporter permease, partial [Oscillospiraceae bacterium]|nr:ABC-2 transporter permease [Oscillospiraceae bacterium]